MPTPFHQNESLIGSIRQRLNSLDVELTLDQLVGIDGMNTAELLRLYATVNRSATQIAATGCLVQVLTESRSRKWD